MGVDFMEHQARFLNRSMSILLLMLFTGCNPAGKQAVEYTMKTVNATSPALKAVNGIVYFNDTLFNGTVYALFAGTNGNCSKRRT